jgi:hypothetical protein
MGVVFLAHYQTLGWEKYFSKFFIFFQNSFTNLEHSSKWTPKCAQKHPSEKSSKWTQKQFTEAPSEHSSKSGTKWIKHYILLRESLPLNKRREPTKKQPKDFRKRVWRKERRKEGTRDLRNNQIKLLSFYTKIRTCSSVLCLCVCVFRVLLWCFRVLPLILSSSSSSSFSFLCNGCWLLGSRLHFERAGLRLSLVVVDWLQVQIQKNFFEFLNGENRRATTRMVVTHSSVPWLLVGWWWWYFCCASWRLLSFGIASLPRGALADRAFAAETGGVGTETGGTKPCGSSESLDKAGNAADSAADYTVEAAGTS